MMRSMRRVFTRTVLRRRRCRADAISTGSLFTPYYPILHSPMPAHACSPPCLRICHRSTRYAVSGGIYARAAIRDVYAMIRGAPKKTARCCALIMQSAARRYSRAESETGGSSAQRI